MTTARGLLTSALRVPMEAAGWTPRAAGWFTRPLSPECLAVVSSSVATKYAAAGEGQAFAYAGLRLHAVEEVVASVCQMKDEGYKQRTVVLGLGYATPAGRWVEWPFTAATVETVAAQLTTDASQHALPYLTRLALDRAGLEAQLRTANSAVDLARRVVFLSLAGQASEASESLSGSLDGLGERTDAASVHMREVGHRLSVWLAGRSG